MCTIAVASFLFAVCAICIALPIGLVYQASNSITTLTSIFCCCCFSDVFVTLFFYSLYNDEQYANYFNKYVIIIRKVLN